LGWDRKLFSTGFLERLFDRTGVQLTDRTDLAELKPIIVIAGDKPDPGRRVVDALGDGLHSAVLILSDEELVHDFRPYRGQSVVLRNYSQPAWSSGVVYTLPLGTSSGLVGLRKSRRGKRFEPSWVCWRFHILETRMESGTKMGTPPAVFA